MLAGSVAGLGLTAVTATPALATCQNVHFNESVYQSDSYHRGVSASNNGVKTGSGGNQCDHVVTLDMFHDDFNQAEIGWRVAPGANTELTCDYPASETSPRFLANFTVGGTQHCVLDSPNLTADHFYGMKLAHGGDDLWHYYRDSGSGWVDLADVQLTYGFAYPATNGERHGSNDSAWALFDGLEYKTTDGTFHPWTIADVQTLAASDPDWHSVVSQSGTHVEVVHD
ncbi:MAG: hypothetical protein ACJ77A_07710 [Actinomycetota bacterium]